MDFDLLIQRKRERFEQLECEIADPSLFENRNRAGEIMREHANVKALLAKWNELSSARMQLADNRELANSTDVDLAQMAQEEIPALEKRVADLEREMQVALLPPVENENCDTEVGCTGSNVCPQPRRRGAFIPAPPRSRFCRRRRKSIWD